ncbi:MAG: DUF1292 domain-containing protein [Bacilli bacterium]|nr:DUF1292 domain-containing protein [Bacilli bacterium]
MDGSGKIIIVNQDETEMEAEIVTYLNSKDSMNQYLVYTKGENQPNGDVIIYISKIKEEDDITKLEEIVDDDEWKDVQKLLKEIANA